MSVYSYTTLDDPLAVKGTYATGINNAGQIVGYYVDSSGVDHGFLYNPNTGTYTMLDDPLATQGTVATGINNEGQIVGTYQSSTKEPLSSPIPTSPPYTHGFLYSGGTYTTLDDPDTNTGTFPKGINDLGQVVGYYGFLESSAASSISFIYSAGNYVGDYSDPNPDEIYVNGPDVINVGINDGGQIVGNYFLYNVITGTVTLLSGINPTGINNDDQIVGTNSSGSVLYSGGNLTSGQNEANTNTGGTYTTIADPLGVQGSTVTGINDAGEIVGYYKDSGGVVHGFLATLPYPQSAGNNDEWILSNGQWAASAGPGSHPSGYQVAGIGDFTFPYNTDDILWYDSSTGDVDEWLMYNGAWNGSVDLGTHPGTGWQIAGTGDFTGSGIDDLLWFNAGTGQTDIWAMYGGLWAASVDPGSHPTGYQVAATGDWTGNGTDGILWYDSTTGDTDEWQLSNGKWASSADLGSHPGNYQIAGVGDFFGNGIDDVLWTSVNSDGTIATDIWELGSNGKWVNSVSPGTHPAGYQVVGIGDFTGNGTSDILWQNPTTGDVDEWLISNGKWAGSIDLGSHPGSFQIAGIGDFTGSGTSDILWHSPS